jgi:hypothetical protein
VFITKRCLSRRTLLRAGAATIGLPLLGAMVPAATALAQTAAARRVRMGFFYLPHGAIMDNTRFGKEANAWTPDVEGRDFDLKATLEPLAPFKPYLTVVSGLGNRPADSPTVHAITPATWLSCVTPRQGQSPQLSVTADQIAARHIGQETPLPSIELATEEGGGGAACDNTYGCSYSSTIAFRTPSTPLPMEFDPRKAFEKIFGRGATPEEREALSRQSSSLLDMVTREIGDLKRRLGPDDRAIIDDYLDSVREIERRIELLGKQDLANAELPDVPVAMPDFDGHLRLMFDIIAAAFQSDMTRIATFMMAAEVSNMAYNHVGIPDAFHPLSHHAESRTSIDKLVVVQRYHSEVFAGFLAKLASMPDGDAGSILDNSVFLYGGNMSNSNKHDHFPLPTLVVGRGHGIAGNQHLRYPDRTPLANLLLTLLQRVGAPVESFGDSTGDLGAV